MRWHSQCIIILLSFLLGYHLVSRIHHRPLGVQKRTKSSGLVWIGQGQVMKHSLRLDIARVRGDIIFDPVKHLKEVVNVTSQASPLNFWFTFEFFIWISVQSHFEFVSKVYFRIMWEWIKIDRVIIYLGKKVSGSKLRLENVRLALISLFYRNILVKGNVPYIVSALNTYWFVYSWAVVPIYIKITQVFILNCLLKY